jgi:hypothetical protein
MIFTHNDDSLGIATKKSDYEHYGVIYSEVGLLVDFSIKPEVRHKRFANLRK